MPLLGHLRKRRTEDAQRFLSDAFADRIAFVAARYLLVRVVNDPTVNGLRPELREAIERFLRDHPVADTPRDHPVADTPREPEDWDPTRPAT